jgi:hypothetical protein
MPTEAAREHEAPDQSEDGSHRCRGRGEQVGRHAVERDRGIEQDEDRLAGQLGGDRDGKEHGERGRHHPGETLGERSGEEEQSGRGGRRQREAVVASEPRVEGEQSDDGDRQRGDAAARTTCCDGDEHHDRHRRGAHDARLRRHQHDEPEQRQEGHPDASTTTQAAERRKGERRAVTIAQLAPETAVRWLSELARIAASSSAPTRVVSPIARPGTSAPPSPPSPDAASARPDRRPTAHASHAGGGATSATSPSTASRNALCSPRAGVRPGPRIRADCRWRASRPERPPWS